MLLYNIVNSFRTGNLALIHPFNKTLYPILGGLINTETFSYIYIDLSAECTDEEILKECTSPDCRKESSLDEMQIKYITQGNKKKEHEYRDSSFFNGDLVDSTHCVRVEINEQISKVNLKESVQDYTGYRAGSKTIWKKLENTFKPYDCFVSGLHFSVTTHSAKKFVKLRDGYLTSFQLYTDAYNDDYRNNFLYLYNLVIAAMQNLKPKSYRCLKVINNEKIDKFIDSIAETIKNYDPGYKGDKLMYDDAVFKKADKITDCIECGTCKLWGKIQILGVATALKILSGQDVEAKDVFYLFHLAYKLCETIDIMEGFDEISKTKDLKKTVKV